MQTESTARWPARFSPDPKGSQTKGLFKMLLLGLLSRALSLVALHFSDWVLQQLASARCASGCCLEFASFWHGLWKHLAQRLVGRSPLSDANDEEWQPEFFGAN